MPKPVAEVGEGHEDASGSGVYCFIRELIVEGKDARFVNKKGRYVINWSRALKCYHNYKSKRNPQYKSKNINRRKASNGLRAALLNFYKKEGAKEYKDCKKVNEKDEVVERQFQMPPRVFESLFGSNVHLSDDSSEHETSSIASEADEKPLATPSSSDTGFDDAMDICDDAVLPSSECALDGLPTGDLLCSNVKTEEDQVNPSDITPPCQMFGIDLSQEDLDSALGEICSSSDNDVDLLGVVRDICPSSGSVKGGLQFYISLTEELSEDDNSCIAHFDGIGDVSLERLNCYTLAGIIPASQKPGDVPVTVISTQDGRSLGMTCFRYVDEIAEVLIQLVHDPAVQSLYFAILSQQQPCFGSDDNIAQTLGSFTLQGSSVQGTHAQALKVLQLLVYTAAQTNAQQFIQMIFSTSAGRLVFNAYKGQPQLPEDVARANGHDDLAQYLQEVTTRLSKEISSDAEPNAIDWLELVEAVNKIQKQSSVNEDETDPESGHSKDEDNQSDYFADAETSSCGSFELEIGCSDSEDGEGPYSKDGGEHKQPDVKSSPSKNVTTFEVPAEVKAQLDNDLDLEDDKNYEEPTIVNSKPTLNLPSVMFRPPRKRRKAAASTQEGACVKETSKTQSIFQIRGGTQSKENTSEREQEARGCLSQEKCTQLKNLDVVQEEKRKKTIKEDDKNYEEPSSFSSKSSWNFFNGYGFFGWLNKWRSGDATTSSLQGEGVNRTQETLQRETVGCPQKRENTNDREEEARRVPSQVKTTKLKRTRKWLKGNDDTRSSHQGASVKETQKVQSFGEGISTESGTQKSENANVRKPSQAKRRAQRSQWSLFRKALLIVLCLVIGIQLQERQLLHWAVRNGHIRISQALIKFVSNVDAPNFHGETPLHVSAKNGYRDLAELLMKLGSNANSKDHQQNTPLHLAALNGHKNVAEVLIRYGSDVNVTNDFGLSPLHWAAKSGHQEITEFLIQHGSDVMAQNGIHVTALHLAALNGHKNVAEVLIRYGSDVNVINYFGQSLLHWAAKSGHQEITEFLVQRGSDVIAQDELQRTPLHLAAQNGYEDLAEMLIQHGSDVNARDHLQRTPLHLAAQKGYENVFEFLILAAKNVYEDLAEMLIQHGSDVNARDYLQRTPLHLAAQNGYEDLAEILRQHGGDVNARDHLQRTPLHLAARNGNRNFAEILIWYGSDVNSGDISRQTPLHLAAQNGYENLIRYESAWRNELGETPLHVGNVTFVDWPVQSGVYKQILVTLIQHGGDVNARDHLPLTSFHLAARNGNEDLAEILIRYGSDVNAKNHQQHTPLYLAALNGHKNVVEVLIRYGSDVNGTNYLGQSPLRQLIIGEVVVSSIFVNTADNLTQAPYEFAASGYKRNKPEKINEDADCKSTLAINRENLRGIWLKWSPSYNQAPYKFDPKTAPVIRTATVLEYLENERSLENQLEEEFCSKDFTPSKLLCIHSEFPFLFAPVNLSTALGNVSGQRDYKLKLNKPLSLSLDGGDTAYLHLGLVIKYQGRCETAYRVKCCSIVTSTCKICPTISASNERPKDRDDEEEKMCYNYSSDVNDSKHFLQNPSYLTGYILLITLVIVSISSTIAICMIVLVIVSLNYLRTRGINGSEKEEVGHLAFQEHNQFVQWFEIARLFSLPLRKDYEEGNVRERDEGWKINKRKRKEELKNICKRFPDTKVEKIFEGSAKDVFSHLTTKT